MRVGLIGRGAIGGVIADALKRGQIENATLSGVLRQRGTDGEFHVASVEELIARSDVVIEAASHAAVAAHGPSVTRAGVDLVVLSVGAFADDRLCEELPAPGGGRVLLSTGACGGVDILRAAHTLQPLDELRLRTTKLSAALARDWMEPDLRQMLLEGEEQATAFSGSAREAVQRFPETANIAGLLALATIGFDAVRVEVVGEPRRTAAKHEIHASGRAGCIASRSRTRFRRRISARARLRPTPFCAASSTKSASSRRAGKQKVGETRCAMVAVGETTRTGTGACSAFSTSCRRSRIQRSALVAEGGSHIV